MIRVGEGSGRGGGGRFEGDIIDVEVRDVR